MYFLCHFKSSTIIVGHNELMTKPATVFSIPSPREGEICFKFRDFSPGIPEFEMTLEKSASIQGKRMSPPATFTNRNLKFIASRFEAISDMCFPYERIFISSSEVTCFCSPLPIFLSVNFFASISDSPASTTNGMSFLLA